VSYFSSYFADDWSPTLSSLYSLDYSSVIAMQAMENFNGEDFAQACADFDRITPLDPWKTSVLVKIKRHLSDAETEENEDDLT